jgi:RHS repeat-associated protein
MFLSKRRLFLSRILDRARGRRRRSRRARWERRQTACAVEQLEDRVLLTAVAWTGAGDGTSWNNAKNWSIQTVPGAGDDVTINLASSQTIIYSSAAGNTTINSLNGNDPFSITGGSLTITGNSTLTGSFSMTGGKLTASGSSVTVSATGTTTLSGGSLLAESGAQLTLPNAASYSNPSSGGDGTTLEATGANSTLSLPALTAFGTLNSDLTVEALERGQTLLASLTSISANPNNVLIAADGTNSEIDISSLTSFSGSDIGFGTPGAELSQTNGGTILDGNVTTLKAVTLVVGAETVALPGLTDIDGGNVTVEDGGSLTLSGIASYANPNSGGDETTLQATGANSTLSLPKLTAFGTLNSDLTVEATEGGQTLLPSLTSISANPNNVLIEADGTNSVIDVSSLTSFSGSDIGFGTPGAELSQTNGGTILDGKLTTLNTVTLIVGAETVALPGLTDLDGSNVAVENGGSLTLSGITSYANPNSGGDETTLQATGANSTLSLPKLTAFGTLNSDLTVEPLEGGQTLLPSLTSISANPNNVLIEADAAGSTVDVSSLTSFSGSDIGFGTPGAELSQTNGGTILDGKLTTLNTVTLVVGAETVTLPGLTDLDGSNVTVENGGSLTLSGITSYANPNSGGDTTLMQATGANSTLSLPALTGLGSLQSTFMIEATEGGQTLLPVLTSISANPDNVLIESDGTGSEIDVSSLVSFIGADIGFGTPGAELSQTNGGSILDGRLTTLLNLTVVVSGETIEMALVTNIDGDSLIVEGGGSLTLPSVTSYSNPNSGDSTLMEATGAGSVLDLPALTVFGTLDSELTVEATLGGQIFLPALATISANSNVQFLSDGVESLLSIAKLNSVGTPGDSVAASSGGTVDLEDGSLTMPASGSGEIINVPQSPTGLVIDLETTGTLTGDTTFNLPEDTTVDIIGGTFTGGATFNVPGGSTVDLTGGQTVTYGGTLVGSGPGTVQLSSGELDVALGGLTLNFAGSMFQWTGGEVSSALGNLINLGTMNLPGSNEKDFWNDGILDNFGTIIQAGGNLGLHSDGTTATTLDNEAGAFYLLDGDADFDNPHGGATAIINAGTIRKTGGSGVSTLLINGSINNTGTIEADSGTLSLDSNTITQVSGSALTGGTWNALNGATLEFPAGTAITTNDGNLTLNRFGSTIVGIAGLAANGGTFTVTGGANFTTAGDFTNAGSLTIGAGSTLTVAGSFSQASPGALNVQIGGSPGSGQLGVLAVDDAATLAGAFNLALVNGFGPSAGQDFPVATFSSSIGAFTSFSGLNPFFTEFLNPTSFDLIDAASNAVDLAATSVTAPTSATVGQEITVNWQADDQSSQAITGSWQDSVYLSTTPTITSNSILLGAVAQTSGLGAGDSYSSSLTAALPALAPGFYFVLVQVDSLFQIPDPNRANNTLSASTGQLNVSVPALALGTPTAGSFTAADQNQYYQVTVPVGGSLQVSIASAATSGAVGLYVSQGSLPTPFNFQESAAVANQPDQTATVPQVLTAGTYYILAHSISGNAATAGFTITATQTGVLSVATPATLTGGNAGNATVEIDGTNFAPGITASLTHGGTTISSSAIDFVSASQIFATFNLNGAAPGGYTLAVQQGAQSATVLAPFEVTAAAAPTPLVITLSTPQFIRSGRTGTIVVTYTNNTANDIVAPLLTITSTNAAVLLSTPDNPNDFTQSAQVLGIASSGPAGILRAGQSGSLTLTLLSEDTVNNDTIPVAVSQLESGQTIDWASQESSLQPSFVPTAAWNVIFNNLLATIGTTTDTYNAALGQAATYLGSLGETTAQVSDVSRLWTFLVSQANDSFPSTTLTSAVDASLSTPGSLSLAIDRTFVSPIAGRDTAGLFGLGWTTSWQASLSTDSSGNVTVNAGGNLGLFVRQPNGTYLDTDAEFGTLAMSGGVFTFTDISGTQDSFLSNGLLSYEQDTNGNRITLGYNAQNQLVTLTYSNPANPSEPTEQLMLSYNSQGFISQIADGTGNLWTYAYDSAGHLLSVTAPGNLTTSYTYDTGSNAETANALLSITNPDASQENFSYDSVTGRLTGTSQNGGADPVSYTYLGQAEVRATDAAGDQTTEFFNDLGFAARVISPLGGTSTFSYDNNGKVVSYTDSAGDTYQYTYDDNGNLTQTVNPLGQTVQMTYGTLGNLTSITDADNNTTSYSYDSAGNLLSITYPDGTSQSFTYDPLGNLQETIEQNGDPVSYQNNAQGLVTSETFADGTSQTFTYDAHGNLLTAETFGAGGTLTGTTTLTYNAANELTSVTYPNGQFLDFTYNAAGQRIQSVDQSGFTVNYTYDALGRLSELNDGSSNLIVQYTYNNVGELTEKLNGNGTSTTYAYDAAGDLTQEVNFAPGEASINSSFTYTYNVLREMTSMTDASGNVTTYAYDPTGQLTQVNLPGGQSITYVYNAAGDRTEVLNNGGPTADSSNSDNEITQVDSTTYTYDANGNLHTVTDASGTTTYTYNDLNQLVSIAASDGTVTTFQYSPLGFLVGETVNGTQTNYVVDPTGLGNVVSSYNGSGSLVADYIYGLGLTAQTGPSGAGYYDFDASGNAVGITGASGTYVNQYSYLPFGETTTTSATLPNPFTFGGEFGVVQITNNLFAMRARVYVPAIGAFSSNDPTGLAGGDSNLRRYVFNNPTTKIDPTGLRTSGHGLVGAAAGAAAFAGAVTGTGTVADVAVDKAPEAAEKVAGAFGLEPIEGATPAQVINSAYLPAGIAAGIPVAGGLGAASVLDAAAAYAAGGEPGPVSPIGADLDDAVNHPDHFLSNDLPPLVAALVNAAINHFLNKISLDPNELVGPTGFGTQQFIQLKSTLPYTVDFENDGSVAAQNVTVTEQMSSNLDWSTFQLGSFGFGPVTVNVPAGLTQYQTTIAYTNTDGTPLDVKVSLDFNVQTGLLTVTFVSLDPTTGQAPTGVFDGFLPPDNSNGIGEGFVQYTIRPIASLTTGATITQQASIVFDTNPPLQTNSVLNTIDSGPPTSSVTALPSTESSTAFTVIWSGTDDAGGSGMSSYSIYVSENGGAFTPFLLGTTETTATFFGQAGQAYGFYSVATDNVGNVQPTPTAAQASTTVTGTQVLAPTVSAPTMATVAENGSLTFTDISVADVAAGTPADQLTLTVGEGGIMLESTSGVTVSGTNGSASFTVSGTPAALNAALAAGLEYTPTSGHSGPDSLVISLENPNDNRTGSATVKLTVGQPPSIAAPSAVSLNENSSLTFSDADVISVSDPSGSGNNAETLTLSVNDGTLSLTTQTGLMVSGNGTVVSPLIVSGNLSNLNADLMTGLVYTPNSGFSGSDTLNLSILDATDQLQGAAGQVAITVNLVLNQPNVTNATTTDNTQTTSGLVVTPNSADTAFVTNFQITGITGGTLFLNNGTTQITSGEFITVAQGGAGLKFTPASNSLTSGSFTVQESTSATTAGLGGPTATATVTVNLVLHQPSVTNATTTENTQTTSGLVITPNTADTAFVTNFQITGISGGTLFLDNGTTQITNNEFITTAQGAAELKFTPTANSTASGSFTVQESTSATTAGLGGPTATATITVNPVSPSLKVTAPATASVNEDSFLVFSTTNGNAISVTDPQAGSGSAQLTLSVTHGVLTLGATKGITLASAASSALQVTLKGTLANLNAALNGLKFTPSTGYSGSASLSVSYKDLGNSQTASASVAITVVVPASQPTVTIKTLFPVAVPGEPVPLVIGVSDTNAAAQAAAFTFAISFGDGKSATVSSKSPLVVNHVYTKSGTFTVSVTATDEFGHISSAATTTVKVVRVAVEVDPFNTRQTALLVGGTMGNDTVSFVASGKNIAVTLNGVSEGVYSTSGPLIVFGQGGKDTVKEAAGLKNALDLLESPTAKNVEADMDAESIAWAGLTAAVEILNA